MFKEHHQERIHSVIFSEHESVHFTYLTANLICSEGKVLMDSKLLTGCSGETKAAALERAAKAIFCSCMP